MELFIYLWLPILVSAAAVWFFGAMAWMILPHHKDEFSGLPNEDAVMDFVRSQNLPAKKYNFPHCAGHEASKDPKFVEKWKTGPAGLLHIWPPISMGRNMLLNFAVCLIASAGLAWVGSMTMPAGSAFKQVFGVIGVAGVLTYTIAALPGAIWFCSTLKSTLACVFDGVVQGLITGVIFAWLWPGV